MEARDPLEHGPDYLAASFELIGVPPDVTVTASEIASYKPAFAHWETFFQRTGADRTRHVHVAASLFHDVEPCAALGLPCVWINRLGETSAVPRAGELPDSAGARRCPRGARPGGRTPSSRLTYTRAVGVEQLGAPSDPYLVLGVSTLASREEIQHAYRSLARQLHPDATAGDPVKAARFAEVSAAYELLRDEARRRTYDLQRAAQHGPRSQRVAPGPTGNTAVRGPAARPSPRRDREHEHEVVRLVRDTDELAIFRTFLKIAVVAIVLFLIGVGVLALNRPPDCAPGVAPPCRVVETPSGR